MVVAVGEEDAVAAYHFAKAVYIAGYEWFAACHTFHTRERETLPMRSKHHHIGCRKNVWHIGANAEQHHSLLQTEFAD